jgi:hypothetical protein
MLAKERSYAVGIDRSKDLFGTALTPFRRVSANHLSGLMELNLLSNLQQHFSDIRTRTTLLFSTREGKINEKMAECRWQPMR